MPEPFLGEQLQTNKLSPVRQVNKWIEDALGPVSQAAGETTSQLGRSFASALGTSYSQPVDTAIRHAGEALPRLGAQALAVGSRLPLLKTAGFGDVATQAFSSTPENATLPQKLGSTAINTAAFGLAPKVGEGVASLIGGKEPSSLLRKVAARGGSLAGTLSAFEAAGQASNVALTGEGYNPLTPEHIAGTAATVLPFELLGLLPRSTAAQMADSVRAKEEQRRVVTTALRDHDGDVNPTPVPNAAAMFRKEDLQGSFGTIAQEVLHEPTRFKLTSDKHGLFDSVQLGNRLKNLVPPTEWEIYRDAGVEEFLKSKPKVTQGEMQEWLKANGPQIEVKEIPAEFKGTPEQEELAALEHWWDSAKPERFVQHRFNGDTLEFADWSPHGQRDMARAIVPMSDDAQMLKHLGTEETVQKYRRMRELHLKTAHLPVGNDSATAKWTMVNPKPLTEMPGAVDLLVRIPYTERTKDAIRRGVDSIGREKESKFKSAHYPNEGQNLVAHVRGYMEGKTFHVFELQSDWAQHVRALQESHDEYVQQYNRQPYGETALSEKSDPLLRHYERLALKAAVDHAVKNGAEKIAISDAETAMLTEQHDQQASSGHFTVEHPDLNGTGDRRYKVLNKETGEEKYFDSFEEAHKYTDANAIPGQDKGMRLHYDRTLPKIAEELTGDKGKVVDFGPHQNARRLGTADEPPLIFKNKDGTPKTNITAREYDLTRFKKELERRGGIPLIGGGKFVLDEPAKMVLADAEADGVVPIQLGRIAEKFKRPERGRGEPLQDYFFRISGLDPNVNKTNDPNTLLRTARDYFNMRWSFHDLPPERADMLTRQSLRYVAALGKTLGETRVLPAEGPASFFASSRGKELSNAFIGMLPYGHRDMAQSWFTATQGLLHEMFHNIGGQAEGTTYGKVSEDMQNAWMKSVELAQTMTRQEMVDTLRAAVRSMLPEGLAKGFEPRLAAYFDTAHYADYGTIAKEFVADFGSLTAMGMVSPRASRQFRFLDDLFRFAPEHFSWLKGVVKDLAQIFSTFKDYARDQLGWKKVAVVEEIHQNLRKLVRTSEEADAAVAQFLAHAEAREARPWQPIARVDYRKFDQAAQMINASNERYDTDVLEAVREASLNIIPQYREEALSGGELKKERRLTWLDKMKPFATQLVRDFPELLATGRLGRSFIGQTYEAMMEMWNNARDPLTGKHDYKGWLKLKAGGVELSAYSAIARKQNENEARLSTEEKKALPEYARLTQEQKDVVDAKLDQASAVTKQAAWMLSRRLKYDIAGRIGRMLMTHNAGMKHEQARELGNALVDVYLEPDLVDPTTGGQKFIEEAALAQQTLAKYANQELLAKGAEAVVRSVDGYAKARRAVLGDYVPGQGFEMKPWFTPELRIGRWQIEYKTADGKDGYVAYKSKKEMEEKSAKLRRDPSVVSVQEKDQQDKIDKYKGLRPDAFASFVDAEKAALDAVVDKLNKESPEYKSALDELQQEFVLGQASAALTESPYAAERRLLDGREELNMAEGLIHYIDSVAYSTSKSKFRSDRRLVLSDPELRANPNLQKHAREYLTELIDPKGKDFPILKNLVFFNYLGLKPSQFLVEMTQQFATHVPALVNQGQGLGEAYAGAVKALKDGAAAILRGRQAKNGGSLYEDPIETRALREAADKHSVSTGWLQEAFHLEEDLPFVNAKNTFSGNGNILTREGLIGKPLYQLLKISRNIYSLGPRWNTEAAFLSSFRHFRKQVASEGLVGESAYKEAWRRADDLTQESMFGGGKASRPLFFLTGKLGPTVGGLMYMLQAYTYNAIAQQGRYLKNAIVNTKLTPVERVSAFKAAGTALTTQVLLAGVMGIPMGSQVIALIEQLFPTSEPKRRMREVFQTVGEKLNKQVSLFQNNEDMGHFLSDAAMDGLLNQGPVDLSNRFQLGGLMGVDPYKGFSWANVVGPSADMLESWFVRAPQALGTGHPAEAAKALAPTSLRQLISVATDGWELRNQDGRLNLDLTAAESSLLAAGFRPKRVAQFQNLNQMQIRAEKVMALDQKAFHARIADMVIAGDVSSARQTLLERAQEVQDYDPREGARRVAELVQARQTPFDPTASASRVGRTYDVGGLFPAQSRASEVDRVSQKHSLVEGLGFRSPVTRIELREAQAVDQLLQMYPRMTRAEAKATLERMLRPRVGQ